MTIGFTDVKFSKDNLDTYYIRLSILNAISDCCPFFAGKLLDVGCGKMPYRQYILDNSKIEEYFGLDLECARKYDNSVTPDYLWDGVIMPFGDNHFDCAIATEVLEHCPEPEIALKEIFRVLKPNGVFFFTVPFLWNLHEVPHDEYRYTPFSLERHLRNAGFSDIVIKATGGWHASMAQMLGLWVKRAPLKNGVRKMLSYVLKPIIGILIRKDQNISRKFKEGQMITGLHGIIKK